jgi:hypothetical protein
LSDIPPVSNGPLPENQTPGYRAARMAVIILSVLIVAAVVALIVGGITRLGGKTASHSATGTFQLPPGARIIEMQTQPGRLILRVRQDHGEEIDILDTQDGRLVGQIKASIGEDRKDAH